MPTREARGRSPRQLPPHPQGLSALGARSDEPPISWLMDKALAHPQIISLAAGFTDSPSLPVAETRAVLEELLTETKAGRGQRCSTAARSAMTPEVTNEGPCIF